MRVAVKPGQWGWSFDDLVASWKVAEEAGFDGLSCFDHVSGNGERAWDAVTLLGVMAASTGRIGLGVHVLNVGLRNPLVLASQLAVVQAASRGRLEVGLGAGSGFAAQDHRAAGVAFSRFGDRVARLEACCRIFPQLWRGETVTEETLGLRQASIGPLKIDAPPLIVGGLSDPVLAVAARHADVWNGSAADLDEWARTAERLDEACSQIGRNRPIEKEGQLFADSFAQIDRFPGLRDHLDALQAAKATRAVVVLHQIRGPQAVEQLAEAVL